MPTTYAHDLFGQKVYRQLPDQVKEIIRKTVNCIGSVFTDRIFSSIILFLRIT